MTSYARPRVRDIPNADGTRAAALSAIASDDAKAYGATSVYDAKDILASDQQSLRNRANPAAARAKRGSTSRAAIVSEGLYFPGEAGNEVATPHSAALSLLDELDIKIDILSQSASGTQAQVTKEASSAARSYRMEMAGLVPNIYLSNDGSTTVQSTSTVAIPSFPIRLRVTWKQTEAVVRFWTAPIGSETWTQLGLDRPALALPLFQNTASVKFGSLWAAGREYLGTIARFSIARTVGGTAVASPDFVAATDGATAIADAQSNVWTVTATTGVDTNDPPFLPHTGEHYVWLPGAAYGNYVVGTGQVRVLGQPEVYQVFGRGFNWNVGTGNGLIFGEANALSYVTVSSTGALSYFCWDSLASAYRSFVSAVSGVVTAATTGVRVEFDGTSAVVLKTSTGTPASPGWVTVDSGSLTAPVTGVASFQAVFGQRRTTASGELHRGDITYAHFSVNNGASVTIFDPATQINTSGNPDAGQSSWVGGGATWSVQRSATGLKTVVVTRPVPVLDGTDDLIQLPASDTPTFTKTTGKHTIVLLDVAHSAPAALSWIYSGESAGSNGMSIVQTATLGNYVFRIGDGTVFPEISLVKTAGRRTVVALVVDNGVFRGWTDNLGFSADVSMGAVGTITHATPKIGVRAHSLSNPYTGEIFACLTFKDQALTATQLDAIAARLLEGAYA